MYPIFLEEFLQENLWKSTTQPTNPLFYQTFNGPSPRCLTQDVLAAAQQRLPGCSSLAVTRWTKNFFRKAGGVGVSQNSWKIWWNCRCFFEKWGLDSSTMRFEASKLGPKKNWNFAIKTIRIQPREADMLSTRLEFLPNHQPTNQNGMFAWIRTKTTKKWYRKPKKNGSYPLVNIQKAIENGHRNSEFSH